MSLPDWTDKKDLSDYVGKAPKRIRQPKKPKSDPGDGDNLFMHNMDYPRVFPFKW
jgi:hypothetical protein